MAKLILSALLFITFAANGALVNSVTVNNPQIPVSQSGIWAIDVTDNFLTDTQLRASPLAVNVQNFPATQNVNVTGGSVAISGDISVSNFPATQTVNGTVAVSNNFLTDSQLRASAVPVSLASTTISNFPATQAISAASLPLPSGASTLSEQQTQTTALQLLDNAIGAVTGTAATASQLVGGIFNTTLPTITSGQQSAIQLDNKGRLLRGVDNGRISYAAATTSAGFTAAATANQDVWRISGSATKTVYIRKIRITATATAVQRNRVSLIKRSTANTGGTLVANTAVPYDSTDVAATASVNHYTAAPTSGTATGQVRTAAYLIPTATSLYNSEMIFEFTENEGNPLVLRGTAEGLGVVFGVAPGAGNLISISVEWDEE